MLLSDGCLHVYLQYESHSVTINQFSISRTVALPPYFPAASIKSTFNIFGTLKTIKRDKNT